MEREEGNHAMRKMVEGKLKLIQPQESKLCTNSRRKLNMLNSLFVKNKWLKLDTLNQALGEINKLASEISMANDLEEKRASSSSNNITMRRQSTSLRVLLTRVEVEDLPISKRTRSKSIDVRPEWMVSNMIDTETDKEIENDRPGFKHAVKRKNSKSTMQQQQKKCSSNVKSAMNTAPSTAKITDDTEDIGKCLTKRKNSQPAKKPKQKKRSMESSNSIPSPPKRKSVATKEPSTDKKVQESVVEPRSKGLKSKEQHPQKKQYKRIVLYDSDTADHVAQSSKVPHNRVEQKVTTKVYPDIPNDNRDIHCQSNFIMKCCLCPYRGVNMVEHYTNKHPQQEVFVSRISPHQSKLIRKCPLPNHSRQTEVLATEAIHRFCHFCEKEQRLTVAEWIKHVAEHTGEYEYCGTEKRPVKEIFFRNNHIFAYLCDTCNYVQIRLSSMEHHLEKQHPSKNNGALRNIEYIRFSVIEKRFSSSNNNFRKDVGKEIILRSKQSMRADTHENGYDSTCSLDTISMIASDDEAVTISMKPAKSPPLLHSGLDSFESENGQVPVCLESMLERELSNVSPSIDSTVLSVTSDKQKNTEPTALITPTEVNEEVLEACMEQQTNTIVGKQSCGKRHNHSRPIPVVISERPMNNSGIYGTSKETVVPCTDEQINTDLKGNRLGDTNRFLCNKSVNAIPKPWIEGSSQKMPFYYESMLQSESLVAFYKCMGHACDFTTQNDKAMEQHVVYHDFSKSFKSEVMQWLECCYCAFFANGPKELVEHLQSVHGGCGYQCNRCFYRSREASALVVHQSIFHCDSEQSNRIFQCTKRVKNYKSSDQGLIIKNMKTNVSLLVCNACPSGTFYGLLSFKDHIESHTFNFTSCSLCYNTYDKMELIAHMQNIHGICLFQCVYCRFGTFHNAWIEHHVSAHHSESIFCYHVRNASQTLEPYVRPRKMIPPHRFVVFSSA